jgi:hypothetical protein
MRYWAPRGAFLNEAVFQAVTPPQEPSIIGRQPNMLHPLSKPAAPSGWPASAPVSGTRHASTPVHISEQEVVFSTAAAALLTPATTHRHWRATRLMAAISHIHIGLPEPRPLYPRREASYFEGARMSRQMDHL